MKEIIDDIESEIDLPSRFYGIEDFNIFYDDDGSALYITVYLMAESLDELPTIPNISDVYKQILEKGVESK